MTLCININVIYLDIFGPEIKNKGKLGPKQKPNFAQQKFNPGPIFFDIVDTIVVDKNFHSPQKDLSILYKLSPLKYRKNKLT